MSKTEFLTPVGRLVQGDPHEAQEKDMHGNLRVVREGPNAGQPNPQFFIAVAFPKADPHGEFAAFYGLLQQAAAQNFPTLFPNAAAGDYTCTHPQFSYKVIDGDGVDSNGKPNAEKEGFAGHWVVRFNSGYPPRIFEHGQYEPHQQIQDKGYIKRGYYVRVAGTIDGNGNPQKPGLYVNLNMVERYAIHTEIVSGPDASAVFGAAPANAPAGITPGQMPPNAQPGQPAPANSAAPTPAAPTPAPAAPAPAAPANPAAPAPAPYEGFIPPAQQPGPGAPAAPATPAPAPAPVAPTTPPSPTASPSNEVQMTAAANGATYQQMLDAGWTHEQMQQQGMIVG